MNSIVDYIISFGLWGGKGFLIALIVITSIYISLVNTLAQYIKSTLVIVFLVYFVVNCISVLSGMYMISIDSYGHGWAVLGFFMMIEIGRFTTLIFIIYISRIVYIKYKEKIIYHNKTSNDKTF